MFLRAKKIKGNYYFYILKNIRRFNSKTPAQVNIEYMGRVEKYSEDEIDTLKKFLKDNDPRLIEYVEKLKQKENPPELYKKRLRRKKLKEMAEKRKKMRIKPDKCIICGFDSVVHLHHVIPVSKGGISRKENLIGLCPNHHEMVHKGLVSEEEIMAYIKEKQENCKGYLIKHLKSL